MSSSPDPLDHSTPADSPRLHQAAGQLSGRSDRRAVEVADAVLSTVLRASRRSLPVRVASSTDNLWVAERVITTLLRRAIDTALEGGAVGRIHLDVDREQQLRELTIELFVQYGQVLPELAVQARTVADATLSPMLTGSEPLVAVVVSHVHVSAVTVADPHLVNPSDEQQAPQPG